VVEAGLLRVVVTEMVEMAEMDSNPVVAAVAVEAAMTAHREGLVETVETAWSSSSPISDMSISSSRSRLLDLPLQERHQPL